MLSLGGGTINLIGGSHTEAVASTTLLPNTASFITQSSGSSVLQLGTITVGTGATLNVSADNIASTNNTNDITGLLGGWATVGAYWAKNSTNGPNGLIVAATTGYTAIPRLGGIIVDTPLSNVQIVSGGTSGPVTLNTSPTTTINSVLQSATDGPVTIDTTGQTLRLGAGGGVLLPSGSGALTIGTASNVGTITAGGAANTAGTLALVNANTVNAMTVNSIIANNGTGAVGLSKSGAGTVILAGSNTYTGPTTVADGTLKIQAPSVVLPGSISGLVVHLDANDVTGTGTNPANGTQVSTWVNKATGGAGDFTILSGTAYPYLNWTANDPNGNSFVHFWGGILRNTTNFDAGDSTVLYVGRMDGGANARLVSSVTNNWLLGYWSGNMDRAYGNSFIASGGATDYNLHLYEATDAAGTMTAYSNGTQIGSGGGQQGPNGLALGGHGAGSGSEQSYGDIGEVLVFNRVLTAAERVQMEQYLKAKWYGVLPSSTTLSLTGSGAAFDLGGVDQTVASLSGVAGSQVALNGGRLTAGGDNSSTTYSGAVVDGSTSGGGVTKVGSGLLTLSGTSASTYTGTTVIQQGSVALSKSAGVTAIPGNIAMLNNLSPNLWMTADNQLGGNGVLSFANEVNTSVGNARFDLEGTTQSLAGISETDAYRNGVIQNSEPGIAGPSNSGTGTLVLTGSGNYSFNAYLRNATGVLALSKTGSGTQTLVGDRITYTGATTVSGGTLALTNTTGFASTITNNAAVSALADSNSSYALRTAQTGTGTWTIDGPGGGTEFQNRVLLRGTSTGANTDGNVSVINSGKLWVDRDRNAIGDAAIVNLASGATFFLFATAGADGDGNFRANETIGGLSGSGTVYSYWQSGTGTAPALTVGGGNVSANFSGNIQPFAGTTNGMTLTKTGNGTQALSGANTYTGATTVNDGVLILSGTASNGPNTITYVNNGELHLGKTPGQNAVASSILNVGDGTGGAGTAIVKLLASNQIPEGLGGADLNIYSDGLFNLNGFDETVNNLLDGFPAGGTVDGGSGTPTLTVQSGSFSGVIKNTNGSLKMVKTGASGDNLVLAGTNTHTGDTVMTGTGGVLQLANFNALQYSTLDTGPAAAPTTVAFAAGTGTYNLGGLKGADNLGFAAGIGANTISVGANGQSTTYAGAIIGTNGKLTKVGPGTLTLTGANTYTGVTNVNNGVLAVNGTHTGAGNYTVNNGGTLKGSGSTSGDLIVLTGGTVAPGTSIESLGVGDILINGGTFEYEINTTLLTADLLYGDNNSTLTLTSGPLLSLIDLGSNSIVPEGDKFTLIAYDGLWNGGTFFGLPDDSAFFAAGNAWLINYNDTTPGSNFQSDALLFGTAFVTITAIVPEPSTWVLGLLGLVGMGVLAWRKLK